MTGKLPSIGAMEPSHETINVDLKNMPRCCLKLTPLENPGALRHLVTKCSVAKAVPPMGEIPITDHAPDGLSHITRPDSLNRGNPQTTVSKHMLLLAERAIGHTLYTHHDQLVNKIDQAFHHATTTRGSDRELPTLLPNE